MSAATVVDRPTKTQDTGTNTGGDAQVVILDTDYNTFDQVIQGCCNIIPSMSVEKARNHAKEVHTQGQSTVWEGHFEIAEHYAVQLASDPYMLKVTVTTGS